MSQEWISVKERLPEDMKKVLFFVEYRYTNRPNELVRTCIVGHYEQRLDGHFGQNGFMWDTPINYVSECDNSLTVTHWQLLPESPE